MYQKILQSALELLFPTEPGIRELESLSPDDMLRALPPSKTFEPAKENAGIPTSILFSYTDETVKQLVWEVKYYRNKKITDAVGALLAQKTMESMMEIHGKNSASDKDKSENGGKNFLIVPIPLTRERLRERGYNHTELLAHAVVKNLNNLTELASTLLKKIRHTPKQSSIENREKRFSNIAGAFEVTDPESVHGKHVFIIDDVITTGATTAEAARVILAAGARSVQVFAIAH